MDKEVPIKLGNPDHILLGGRMRSLAALVMSMFWHVTMQTHGCFLNGITTSSSSAWCHITEHCRDVLSIAVDGERMRQ